MSNFAYALPTPLSSPRGNEAPPTRQIEIVTSRSQRRARPRVVYSMVAVGSLFLIFMVQLLLSIALSNGAYEISKLTIDQRDLGRTQSALNENLQINASPQNLAAKAAALGMGQSGNPTYINLGNGKVTGAQTPALTVAALNPAIKNALLTANPEGTNFIGKPVAGATADPSTAAPAAGTTAGAVPTNDAAAAGATATGSGTTTGDTATTDSLTGNDSAAGAPAGSAASASVPSTPGTLPSPTTH